VPILRGVGFVFKAIYNISDGSGDGSGVDDGSGGDGSVDASARRVRAADCSGGGDSPGPDPTDPISTGTDSIGAGGSDGGGGAYAEMNFYYFGNSAGNGGYQGPISFVLSYDNNPTITDPTLSLPLPYDVSSSGGGNEAPSNAPTVSHCLGVAGRKNGVALALDAASLGVDAFGPEAQYAKLGIGLGLSTASMINSAASHDMTGTGLGMASYLKAPTELAATSAGWG